MSIGVPVRLANGIGNTPDSDKWMTDYDYLTALIHGNFTLNGGIENWNGGTTFTNPATATPVADSWTTLKSGTTPASADVSREATIIDIVGTYSMKVNITGAGSSDSIWDVHQALASPTRFRSETVLFGAKVWCATANKVRVKISDGVTTAYSTYHTGNSQWQTLNAMLAISGSAASVTITVEANPSDFTGAFYIDSVFTYVVPAQITVTARAALTFLNLFSGYLSQAGGLLTGPLAMGANDITGLVDAGITPATAGATSTGTQNRFAQLANQIKTGFGLTNWYDAVTAMLAKAGGQLSGNLSFDNNSTHGIVGTPTNDSAAAGNVGEYIESVFSAVNFPTSTAYGDATSIALTTGDWDVTLTIWLNPASVGPTEWTAGISKTTGNSTTGLVFGSNYAPHLNPPVSAAINAGFASISNYRQSLSGNTTIYAKLSAVFSGTAPQAYGRLSARRYR